MDFSFLTASTAIDSGSEDGFLISSMPLQNFNFWLLVEGVMSVPLKSVRAFQKTNQYERIKEGGVNDYVTLKRSQIQEPHQLVVERYMMSSLVDPLANGAELTLPLILGIDHASRSWSDSTHAARYYAFTGCTVMSKEYGELNAERSGLATETITIGYKMMYLVPNLLSMGGDPSKAPTTNNSIGDAAVTESINKQLVAKAQEEQKRLEKAEQLQEWAQRRADENKNMEVDPTEYGAKVKTDKDGKPVLDDNGKKQYEWPTPTPAPKESDYFKTDANGNVQKDDNGNPVPKGDNARQQAENRAAYEKKKAEAEASAAQIEKQKADYKEASERVANEKTASDSKKNAQDKAKERRAAENKGDIKAENYEGGEESADYKRQQAYQESQQDEANRRSDEQTERKNQEAENTKAYENAQQDEANRRTGEQAGRKTRETRNTEAYNKAQQDEADRRTTEQNRRKTIEAAESIDYNNSRSKNSNNSGSKNNNKK